MNGNRATFILFAVFAAIGLGFLLAAGGLFAAELRFRETAGETFGVITGIGRSNSGADNYTPVYVEYEVDGRVYESRLNYYASTMRVGERRKLYYDPANPLKVHGAAYATQIILGAIGLGFGGIGGAGVAVALVTARRRALLKATGRKYRAALTGVTAGNLRVNGVNGTVLLCEAANEIGEAMRFKSGNMWPNRSEIDLFYSRETDELPGVDVYVDPYDERKYFVDTEAFLEELKR